MLYRSPDPLPPAFQRPSVFIAGGISDCPDWQAEMVGMLDHDRNDVVNPRRIGGFDKTGATAREQITWEHHALSMVDSCIFWFPRETLCPITLFELGKMLEKTMETSGMTLAVGWHPEYARAFDLEVQIPLATTLPYRLVHSGPGWHELCTAARRIWG